MYQNKCSFDCSDFIFFIFVVESVMQCRQLRTTLNWFKSVNSLWAVHTGNVYNVVSLKYCLNHSTTFRILIHPNILQPFIKDNPLYNSILNSTYLMHLPGVLWQWPLWMDQLDPVLASMHQTQAQRMCLQYAQKPSGMADAAFIWLRWNRKHTAGIFRLRPVCIHTSAHSQAVAPTWRWLLWICSSKQQIWDGYCNEMGLEESWHGQP